MKKINKGFTLVELIIVIAVIGVLAAVLIPVFSNVVNKANQKSALSDARNAVSTITAEVTDGAGQEMPDSLMFAKKGGKVYAFAYTQNTGLEAFDEEGFTMLTNGANDQENFDNTVEAYVQELVSEGYAAAATTARSNLLMKAYRTINPAETRANYAQLTDDEKLQVMHSMIQNVSFDPDKFVLQFSYTPTQAFFADHEVVAPVAQGTTFTINGVEHNDITTVSGAIAAASNGDTIRMYQDENTNAIIEIGKSITLDGNGHTVESTANRGINITASDIEVTLKNFKLHVNNNQSYIRGINIWDVTGVKLNLINCEVTINDYYAINAIMGSQADITIEASHIKGWAAVNAYGSGHSIVVRNSVLEGINEHSGSTNNFATFVLEGDTTMHTDDHSSDYNVLIEDSVIIANQTRGKRQAAVGFNAQSQNNTLTLRNCDIITNDNGGLQARVMYVQGKNTVEAFDNCTFNGKLNGEFEEYRLNYSDYYDETSPYHNYWDLYFISEE